MAQKTAISIGQCILDGIMSKLSEEEWEYLKGAMNDTPDAILITMEGDDKYQTETQKNIRQIGVKVKKSTKFHPQEFMEAFNKFVVDNKLNLDLPTEWKKRVEEKTNNQGLRNFCISHGPMRKIPIYFGINTEKAKESEFADDGSVSTDMETLLYIDENIRMEEERRHFLSDYEDACKRRKDMISEFRMKWRSR